MKTSSILITKGDNKMANSNHDKKKVTLIDSYNKNTTNKVLRLIQKNPKGWQQSMANNPMVSISGDTPVAYKGVNAISLAITNADRNNTDNRFMTRRAVEKTDGLAIKQGAKAMQISYLRNKAVKVKGETKEIPMMSVGYVYSANDITGIKSIKGIKPAPKDLSALSLSQQQLIEKSSIPVVRSDKTLISEFNIEKNEIQIASSVFDKGGDGLVSHYAALATKAAVEQNYLKDSQDMKAFKSQMSAALIVQSVGAKLTLKGTVKEVKNDFNTEFLNNAKSGMSAIRSSAKIANFVANGRRFERLKKKEKTVEKPKADKQEAVKKPKADKQEKTVEKQKADKQEAVKKPTAREKLDKQRTNGKETGRGSR
jgi:hypothetical protein